MIRELLRKLRKKNKPLYRSGWDLSHVIELSSSYSVSQPFSTYSTGQISEKKLDERIEKKPAEVYKEILCEEPKINLIGLDKQIKMVKRRLSMIEELNANPTDEKEAIQFLEARQKYEKNKKLFNWPTSSNSLIDELCKKYKVKFSDFSSYYKTIPMEAIDELEKFLDAYRKVRNDEPVVKLIVDDGGEETKKDPILLASSPFGRWWYILGAWDKEVEIVDDLIYKFK